MGPRGAAVQGPYGGTAVVRPVPVGARAVAIAGATYYVASGVYYRPVYQGSEVVYQQGKTPSSPVAIRPSPRICLPGAVRDF